MKTFKFHHRLLALLVAALVLCASAPMHLHAHAESVNSPGAGDVTPPAADCEHVWEEGVCTLCAKVCEHEKEEYAYDTYDHWTVCVECGMNTQGGKDFHYGSCTSPTECAVCHGPYSGDRVEHVTASGEIWYNSSSFDWDAYKSDATHHWYECETCGGKIESEEHYGYCSTPGFCEICMAGEGITITEENTWHERDHDGDETHHWWVCDCGATGGKEEHQVPCWDNEAGNCWDCPDFIATGLEPNVHSYNEDGVCEYCGEVLNCDHDIDIHGGGAWDDCGNHYYYCGMCDTVIKKEACYVSCANPNSVYCYLCGEFINKKMDVVHTGEEEWRYDTNEHWTVCVECGEKTGGDFHIAGAAATCTTAQICTVCEAELAPAKGHNFWNKVTEPTCTEEGYTEYGCYVCGMSYVDSKRVPATGHDMQTVTVGLTTYSICSVCNHTEGAVTADGAATAPTVVVNEIKDATYVPVDTTAVVSDLVLEVEEQLVYEGEGLELALRVLDLRLVNKAGQEVVVSSKIRVSIPCEGMDLENVRLVLIQEDGELIEIEFTVENGMMIFETEALGMFALLPAAE